MADIVPSLFGIDPVALKAQQDAQANNDIFKISQLDGQQGMNYLMMSGARDIGKAINSTFGLKTPEELHQEQTNKALQDIQQTLTPEDLADPTKMLSAIIQHPDVPPDMKQHAYDQLQKVQLDQAKIKNEDAQATHWKNINDQFNTEQTNKLAFQKAYQELVAKKAATRETPTPEEINSLAMQYSDAKSVMTTNAGIIKADTTEQGKVDRMSIDQRMGMLNNLISQGKNTPEQKVEYDNLVKAKTAGKVAGNFKLTPEQNDALFGVNGAVAKGLVDPSRLNARTAPLFADAFISNPNQDMVYAAGVAAEAKSPSLRNKSQMLEALPDIMQNVVAAGKKLDFSKVAFVGKLQGWLKGQSNDPDFENYMTQRNDALLEIAGAMRSVGMSDRTHMAEQEVMNPTMAPQALEAWLKGQMTALQPRLEKNRRIFSSKVEVSPPNKEFNKPKGTPGYDAYIAKFKELNGNPEAQTRLTNAARQAGVVK